LERRCGELEQKKQAAEMEQKQIIDKLWDTYELTFTSAVECRLQATDIPEMKRRISELQKEIKKLGTPNIGAIEEFDRVNERYTYLKEQRDDAQKSKDELLKIIGGITDEMKVVFAERFDAINESFKQTFLELFGGGKAALELEDTSDILNCGIEIRVQPPGKSLKTISLLSGGEKAFVAIALYFSILKIRPTPFVVMDEIEAALDEANVLRYAEYMRRLCDKTQMIVITHRRGTMEEADVLYGVTMQEQGVSRILTIDVEEAERTINS
ncbi:MAG: chromosome segregation protein SMC, partial [Oscillospiraceae bacterium]|nr:chromosome segregation protein SMC [Oscillospiraceae bacterium]